MKSYKEIDKLRKSIEAQREQAIKDLGNQVSDDPDINLILFANTNLLLGKLHMLYWVLDEPLPDFDNPN